MNKSRKILGGVAVFLYLFAGSLAFAEIKTITATGEYRMGDNDTRTDAKRLALLDAKRLALEQAGTYLESVTEVKNLRVSHDELRAYTAGIVEVTELATKDVMEGATHIIRVEVTAKIDMGLMARQINALRKNEEAKAEMLRLQKENEHWRQETQAKTRELNALKSKTEIEAALQARQQVLNKMQANYLLSYAWAAFEDRGSKSSDGVLAKALTDSALTLDPDNPAGHFMLGMILSEGKNFQAAISEFREALHFGRNFTTADIAGIHIMMGRALKSSGDLSGALVEFQKAVSLAPTSASAHFDVGTIMWQQENFEQAILEFQTVIRLSPGNADAHLMMGLALQGRGQHDEAIVEFLAALRLDPEGNLAIGGLLSSALQLYNRDDMVTKIRTTIANTPEDAGGFVALGLILSMPPRPDWDAAIMAFREALRLRPRYALAHYHLGQTLFQKGERDSGIAEMRMAVELRPNDAGFHFFLGDMLRKRHFNPDVAIIEFREGLRLDPTNTHARLALGGALRDKGYHLWEKGELREAINQFREALHFNPDDVSAHVYLGALLRDIGEKDSASSEFEQALRLNPAYAAAGHRNAGDLYKGKKNLDRAVDEYHEALRLELEEVPKMSIEKLKDSYSPFPYEEIKAHFLTDVYWKLGLILEDQKDFDGAITEYRRASGVSPEFAHPHIGVGDILLKKNEVDAAIAEYREAVRLHPKGAYGHFALATALKKKGDLSNAIAEYREALRLAPDLGEGNGWNDLGIALYESGDFEGAIVAFREAVRMRPNEAVIHYSLGYALQKKGAVQDAAREFEEVIQLGSDAPDKSKIVSDARARLKKLKTVGK